jgi:glycosyltransferase involved in cell wall biosynthesis
VRLGLAARGDPRSRSTWSGTPSALHEAFVGMGAEVDARSLAKDSVWLKSITAPNGIIRYGRKGRGFFSFLWPRATLAHSEMARWRRENAGLAILHTDTMWLPYDGFGDEDYLYRDTTWRSMANAWELPPRMTEELDEIHREVYTKAHHIFATSAWAREDFITSYDIPPTRVSVVGTGSGAVRFSTAEKDYSNGKTLFVGRARFVQKGGRLLVEAFDLAHRKNPHVTLTIVGPPEERVSRDGLTYLTNVDDDHLINLFREAALFAMPAFWEPWGLVYIEAQLAAVPILGLDRCAFPELSDGGRTGFAVPEASPKSLAETIVDAHSDPKRLRSMGSAGRSHAAQYSWAQAGRQMLELMLNETIAVQE